MSPSRQVVVVLVTCPPAAARRLARGLVSERLAACVNIVPMVASWFWWQGKIQRCREALLVIKTTAARVERLRQTMLHTHPYDVPEILALPVVAGHPAYLRWVVNSLTSTETNRHT